jgi:hypothetical protein
MPQNAVEERAEVRSDRQTLCIAIPFERIESDFRRLRDFVLNDLDRIVESDVGGNYTATALISASTTRWRASATPRETQASCHSAAGSPSHGALSPPPCITPSERTRPRIRHAAIRVGGREIELVIAWRGGRHLTLDNRARLVLRAERTSRTVLRAAFDAYEAVLRRDAAHRDLFVQRANRAVPVPGGRRRRASRVAAPGRLGVVGRNNAQEADRTAIPTVVRIIGDAERGRRDSDARRKLSLALSAPMRSGSRRSTGRQVASMPATTSGRGHGMTVHASAATTCAPSSAISRSRSACWRSTMSCIAGSRSARSPASEWPTVELSNRSNAARTAWRSAPSVTSPAMARLISTRRDKASPLCAPCGVGGRLDVLGERLQLRELRTRGVVLGGEFRP